MRYPILQHWFLAGKCWLVVVVVWLWQVWLWLVGGVVWLCVAAGGTCLLGLKLEWWGRLWVVVVLLGWLLVNWGQLLLVVFAVVHPHPCKASVGAGEVGTSSASSGICQDRVVEQLKDRHLQSWCNGKLLQAQNVSRFGPFWALIKKKQTCYAHYHIHHP